jgi:ABC-type antimicrobial peptide transport system permease subunit
LLLSASTAKAFFGEMDPLGQMVEMDGGIVFHVVGVYRDFPSRSSWNNVRFLGQWAMYATVSELDKMEDPWRPNAFQLFVMLRDNASFSDASRRIKDAKLKRLNEALAKKKPVLFIHPMKDWYLRSEFRNGKQAGGRIQYVWMFGIVGVFVLLMACINFMNLSTARSEKRAKEVGIRKAVGSYRSQLVTQFFSESLFTTFIALVFAIVLAHLTIPLFNTMSEKAMTLPWDDPDLWFVAVVSALLIGIVAGSYPALYLSGIRPVRALKGTFKSGRNASAARRVLVVLQFGVSVIMIIGTSTVFLQIQHGKNRPLGFNVNGLISIPTTTQEVHQHFDVIRKSLLDDAWIVEMAESVAPATEGWSSSSRIEWNGKDPDIAVDFNIFEGSFEYGRTLQWEVLQGRDFSRDFPSDSSAVIMNEAAAGYLNKHNVVGELLRVNGQACTIIGVVKDVVFGDPYQPVRPSLYFVSQRIEHFLTLRLNPSKPAAASLAAIEQVIKPHLKGEPFQYQFLDADQALKFADEERVGVLAGAFTGLAIFISCLGIFGLSSFVAEQRTKEIGLRKVLGANFTQVWMLISMDFLVLVLISCLIAAPVAVWLLRSWLEGYEYRVALPYWVFLVTAVATLVITIITISGHVIRAARLNPAQTLKVE